jgi:hypothetical protein
VEEANDAQCECESIMHRCVATVTVASHYYDMVTSSAGEREREKESLAKRSGGHSIQRHMCPNSVCLISAISHRAMQSLPESLHSKDRHENLFS